jgi:DNA-binding CsgD family transcriptional regulator
VVDALTGAARTAMGRGAAESAVACLRRAMAEPPAQERQVEVGFALGTAQSFVSGQESVAPLRAAYERAADPVLRARIATRLAEVLFFTTQPEEVARVTAEAQAGLDPAHRDLWEHLEGWRLAVAHLVPQVVPVLTEAEIGRLVPTGDGDGGRSLAGSIAYQWAFSGGRAEDVVPVALHAVGGESLRGSEAAGAPRVGAVITLLLADREEGFAATADLLDTAHRQGSLLIATGAVLFRGLALALRGELEDAEGYLLEAMAGHRSWGTRSVQMFYSSYLAHVKVARGDVAGALEVLAGVGMPPDESLPASSTTALWLHARLRTMVAAGRHEEAVAITRLCAGDLARVVPNPAWIPWRSLGAESLSALGRREEAVALAAEEVPHARRWGGPRVLARSLRVAGTLAADLALLEEAEQLAAGSPARLEHAECLCALGTHLRLARRPTEAREPLRRALELASGSGARPLAERARTELHATGARPRTDALSGVMALTASERRVAELALDGATNKDIAQALYVTPKTVEVHLSSTYRKLGIRSRRDLAGALAAA